MEYYVKSVVPIIESNYDKFTTVERNIADFFIQNRKKVDFSAKSIAERLFVSEASLSRFAIGWSLADIKGIRPSMCMHRILLEDNSKPSVEAQRRLNPTMKEVV